MQFSSPDEVMRRAIELAERGLGAVEPNPPVGAVIVDDDLRPVGEGSHEHFGGPHAEANALSAAGSAAKDGTLYVTLEPCNHTGKTPPCTEAIIAAGIRRVVIGCSDPVPHQTEAGAERLRAAGVEVEVGVCRAEAESLVAPFVKLHLQRKPWVHAKWAMTLDGRIATRTGSSKWITGEESRAVVHQLRGRMDAIITGIGTVLADDPLLTARPPGPRTATRVVLDTTGSLPRDSQLVRTASAGPVLWVLADSVRLDNPEVAEEVELVRLPADAAGKPSLEYLLEELGRRQMTHVLLEAGAGVLGAAFDAGLVDECHVFIAGKVVGGQAALSPIGGMGVAALSDAAQFIAAAIEQVGADVYWHGRLMG